MYISIFFKIKKIATIFNQIYANEKSISNM